MFGIYLNQSHENTIGYSIINNNDYGISIAGSTQNTITNCTVNQNTQVGINIDFSNYNTIKGAT